MAIIVLKSYNNYFSILVFPVMFYIEIVFASKSWFCKSGRGEPQKQHWHKKLERQFQWSICDKTPGCKMQTCLQQTFTSLFYYVT